MSRAISCARRLFLRPIGGTVPPLIALSLAMITQRLPLTVPTDRDAIGAMLDTLRPFTAEDLRLVHIRNTLAVERLVVSEGCLPALQDRLDVIIEEEPRFLGFDGDARLISPLSG